MRLRLDKLVLSAGLALAMVATSIPAIAGTSTVTPTESDGLSLNGSTVHLDQTAITESTIATSSTTSTLAFATAVTGLSLGGDAEAKTGLTGKVTSVEVTETTSNSVDTETNTLIKEAKADGYPIVANSGQETPGYTVKVESSYSYKMNVDLSTEVTNAITGETDETKKVAAGMAEITAANAATKLLTADFENINNKVKVDSATTDFDYGTKQTTSVGNDVDASDGIEVTSDLTSIKTVEALKAAASSIEVTLTKTATTTYKLTKLPSGYTYDLLFTANSDKEYKVYKQDSSDSENIQVTPIESSLVNDNGKVKISVSDIKGDLTYFLGAKTVSTSGALLFGDDGTEADNLTQDIVVSDTVTLTVKSVTVPRDSADFDTVAKANNAKIAGYFTANLSTGNYTDSEVTVKIVKPKDIEALAGEGKTIKYTVIRQHTGMPIEALETNSDGEYITFSSKYFSTFALAYEIVDATTEEATEEASNPTDGTTVADATAATEAADSTAGTSTTSTTASEKTGDNSMMPLFMTTLLLALCAGSLAIYKEKKTY